MCKKKIIVLRVASRPGGTRKAMAPALTPPRRYRRSFVSKGRFAMAGLANNPVQVLSTGRALYWVKFTFETGFELPSSCANPPGYAPNLNRNILDFMRWPHIGLGAQDLNDIQRPNTFQKSSWK
jgi:hypothetical protein